MAKEKLQEEEIKEEKKQIVFRELLSGDIFLVSALVDAADIDIKSIKLDNKNAKQLGFEIIYLVFRKINKAKKEVNELISALSGLKVSEIEKMPLVEYGKLLFQLKELKGLMELFK